MPSLLKKIHSLLLLFFLFCSISWAEQAQSITEDRAVVQGQLSNGLTYFIRENANSGRNALLQLIVRVGSVQEEESERGIAHFVKHCNILAARQFEEGGIFTHLRSFGAKNPQIEAYTYFSKTTYSLDIPVESFETLDKGILTLREWAGNVPMTPETVELARGIVLQQWLQKQGGRQRFQDQLLPVLLEGSDFAHRFPFGQESVIRFSEPEVIQNFYKKWYKPELMAVVAVGDFNAEQVEKLIQKHFSQLSKNEEPITISPSSVPPYGKMRFVVYADPETTTSKLSFMFKRAFTPQRKLQDVKLAVIRDLIPMLLDARMHELTNQEFSPFLKAGSMSWPYTHALEVLELEATCLEESVLQAAKSMFTEVKRVQKRGFTAGELQRAKANYLLELDRIAYEDQHPSNLALGMRYFTSFDDEVSPIDIAEIIKHKKRFLNEITLDEVGIEAVSLLNEEDCLVSAFVPDNDMIPELTEYDFELIFAQVRAHDVAKWSEILPVGQLFAHTVDRGSIVSELKFNELEITEFTLGNGLKVCVKPSSVNQDEVLIRGFAPGGLSSLSAVDLPSGQLANAVAAESGIGGFSPLELQKILSGQRVEISTDIQTHSRTIQGVCHPKNLDSALQLVHLLFTEKVNRKDAFNKVIKKTQAAMKNRDNDPSTAFIDRVTKVNTQSAEIFQPLTRDKLTHVDYEKVNDFYESSFSQPSDFTLFIVGAVDPKALKPLLEEYLASIPEQNHRINFSPNKAFDIQFADGIVHEVVSKGISGESRAHISFPVSLPDANDKDISQLEIACKLLEVKLHHILQKKLGGTYAVSVDYSTPLFPLTRFGVITIAFGGSSNNIQRLVGATFNALRHLQKQGPTMDEFQAVKESQWRYYQSATHDNHFWAQALPYYYALQGDYLSVSHWKDKLASLDSTELQEVYQRYFTLDHYTLVYLFPES